MNEPKPSTTFSPQRRRQLLRGAISAPVVLTISSGASATMTSNLRCVANQVNTAPSGRTYAAGTGVPTTVVRVKLYRNSASTRYFISGTELGLLAHTDKPVSWISDGQWQEFNPSTNLRVGTPVTVGTLGFTPSATSPWMYANVQVDQLGYILSVGKNTTTSTSMVAATCWNSFRASI